MTTCPDCDGEGLWETCDRCTLRVDKCDCEYDPTGLHYIERRCDECHGTGEIEDNE